jgi:hypothetical protein
VKPPDSITILYLVVVLLLMPALGILSWFRVRSGKPLPSNTRRYQTMIVMQFALLAWTSLVARQNSFHLLDSNLPPAWSGSQPPRISHLSRRGFTSAGAALLKNKNGGPG